MCKFLLIIICLLWAVVTVVLLILLRRERSLRRKQTEELSCRISCILERKARVFSNTYQDTLEDKLACQMDKLQELLEYYDQRLWEEQESIKKLITEIAHQLRTPLANIESYLTLCEQNFREQKLREQNHCEQKFCEQDDAGKELAVYLEAIRISEEKLSFLIRSFIKISRLEHYCIQIKKENQDLRETILQSMVAVTKKAEEKQVNLKILTTEPVIVPHDKNWLKEAVENLLDNSIKYSLTGGVVKIGCQHNDMFTRIQVRDYGIGIDAGEEADVFKRFYRGKRVTTQEGFGIGLYLAREIVLRHDGFMKATRKEKGLLVEIYLPGL